MQLALWLDHRMSNIGLSIWDYMHEQLFFLNINCKESDVVAERSNRLWPKMMSDLARQVQVRCCLLVPHFTIL